MCGKWWLSEITFAYIALKSLNRKPYSLEIFNCSLAHENGNNRINARNEIIDLRITISEMEKLNGQNHQSKLFWEGISETDILLPR